MKDHFCNLHCHSTYSFTDAVGSPEQYAERAKELGQPALGVTDHGNVSAHYKWYTECKKRDVKPVLGCELYIVEREDQIRMPMYYHITVLVLNKIGYRNLMQLVTKGWCEQFYYKPKITFQDLINHQEGLAVLSGCLSGPVLQELHKGSDKKAKDNFDLLSKNIKNFYIEMQPIDFDGGLQAYQKFIELSKNYPNVPWIVTSDCHCVKEKHLKTQEIMLCVQSKSLWDDPDRWRFDQKDLYLKSRKEMEDGMNRIFPDVKWKEALDNTIKLADKVDFEFPSATPIKFPVPEKEKVPLLKRMCKEGLKKRGLEKSEYKERMEYELDIIIQKNFVDYFLVVADIVKWSKDNNILVGPARGSAAGSLVCYLAEITEVDPIEYDLIFERFIDLNREDMPDIDVDFEDARRGEIKQYIEDKYGSDKVGTLPIFATFKGRSAIDDIGRIFKIPFSETDRLKGMIIERSGGDSRASFTIEDTFESFPAAKKIVDAHPDLKQAAMMEGQIRQMGKHAAGMVVSNEPLINFCAIYKVKDQFVTSLDYKDASSIGLLKLDLLGLNTLTVIHKTTDLIKERHDKDVKVYDLPLDDKKTYKSFRDGKLFGVFQFDGQAVNQVCRQIKPNDFESLSAISALGRPGPLNGGSTTEYIMRRSGKEKIVYPHEIMKDYTEETYGVVIYQEQVMKTMRNVGKMSWKDTAEIRMNISKSQGVEKFNQYKETFAIGAKENGMDNKQIDDMWDAICTFGSWAFNKCISGDTVLINANYNQFSEKEITIKELYKNKGYATSRWKEQPKVYKKMNTLGMDLDGQIRPSRIKDVFYKGKKTIHEITTESGQSIRATSNHRFLGQNGFKKVHKFSNGEFIAVNGGIQEKEYLPKGDLGKGWRKGRAGGAGDSKDGSSYEVNKFQELNKGKCCEHCSVMNDRMEVHHVTKTPPKSILEWLCPSCHKKAEYKIGRTKVWEKGFPIKYEKIKSIENLGEEDVYDVEMEDQSRPSFIANGFVSHNSHSVSYTLISYWTMWLKVHYPMEFYSSILSLTSQEEKQKKIIKEYKREGYKVLPIDINKSKKHFVIDGDKIRIGFADVKGIGDKSSEIIVRNQPYVSYEQYVGKNKRKFNMSHLDEMSKIDQLLIDLGAFDSIPQSNMIDLFGNKAVWYSKKNIPFAERWNACPWDIEFNIVDEWLPILKKYPKTFKTVPTPIENLSGKEGKEFVIWGIVYDKNLKDVVEEAMSRGKKPPQLKNGLSKFCNFILEDDSDFITIRVSPHYFPEFKELIFERLREDDVVIMKGKMGSGIRMFFVNKMVCLREFDEKHSNENDSKIKTLEPSS